MWNKILYLGFMTRLLFLILVVCYSCSAQNPENEVEESAFSYQLEIPTGGNSYTESVLHQNQITEAGIPPWTDSNAIWDTYVYLDKAGTHTLGLKLNTSNSCKLQVSVASNAIETAIGPNSTSLHRVGSFVFEQGYNKIQIRGSQSTSGYPAIASLVLLNNMPITGHLVVDNVDNRFYWGRRGPSVHLSFTPPPGKDIEYYYTELLIPEGEDAVGSYFMANGFAQGYFGIQVNSESERRILFSVWSPYNTDNPGEIPEEFKIKLLAKGEGVYTGEFGNEGSGGQSYKIFPWKAETAYGFLTRAVPDEAGNTTFTSYFRETETGQWQLIASFLRPKTQTWYTRPHAFLENFIDHSGYLGRRVQYNNPWVYTTTGEWIPLTEARFTTDDIGNREYRKDLSGGIDSGRFYLRNGGFFNGEVEPNQGFDLDVNNTMPDINLESLPKA